MSSMVKKMRGMMCQAMRDKLRARIGTRSNRDLKLFSNTNNLRKKIRMKFFRVYEPTEYTGIENKE